MGKDTVALIIPLWKTNPTTLEMKRISHSIKVFGLEHSFLVGPKSLDFRTYQNQISSIKFRRFSGRHFSSRHAYSRWLLTESLYKSFADYEFILICQPDAVLIRKPVPEKWDWDYVGASWNPPIRVAWSPIRRSVVHSGFGLNWKTFAVGNGGLSIRRTRAFIDFTRRLPGMLQIQHEDIVIGYFGDQFGLRIAPKIQADSLFLEESASGWKSGHSIPEVLGFHALEKFNPELEDQILRTI